MIVMIMADHNEVDLRQILEANARLRYTLGAQRREGAGIIRPDRIGKDIESTRLHQHRGVTNPDGLHLSGLHVHLRLRRSEEHTSELQSLMRISYAVFCLK